MNPDEQNQEKEPTPEEEMLQGIEEEEKAQKEIFSQETKPKKEEETPWNLPEGEPEEVVKAVEGVEQDKRQRFYEDLKVLEIAKKEQEEKKRQQFEAEGGLEKRLTEQQSHYDRLFEKQRLEHQEEIGKLTKEIAELKKGSPEDQARKEEARIKEVEDEIVSTFSEEEKKDYADDTILQKTVRHLAKLSILREGPKAEEQETGASKEQARTDGGQGGMTQEQFRLAYLEHDRIVSKKHQDWEEICFRDSDISKGMTPQWANFVDSLTPQEKAELQTGGPQAAIKYLDRYKGNQAEDLKKLEEQRLDNEKRIREMAFGGQMTGSTGSQAMEKEGAGGGGERKKGGDETEDPDFVKGCEEEENYQKKLSSQGFG